MKHRTVGCGRMSRREFLPSTAGALLATGLSGWASEVAPAAGQPPLYWAWWCWEPLDHYRRTGGIVGAVDTRAPEMPQWYERIHSEEVVRMMSELGVNLACTHFFKGFGLVHERAEQQRTAGLVQIAHRHGIKVLGYCGSNSIYRAQFFEEVPEAEGWLARDEKGAVRKWGGKDFRPMPCPLGREYLDYLKRAIRTGLEEVKLDGLHFDNCYALPCYCDRCHEAFRGWLTARHPHPQERFGRDSFHEVSIPLAEKPAPAQITDPLTREWVRWRCETQAARQAELAQHAREIKPDVLLLGNPAYPREANSPYLRSIWAPWFGQHLDLMFAENGNFSRIEDGAMVSQVRAFKHAAATGYRVVSTVWKRNKLTAHGLPDTEEEIALQIAESAANGAVPGTNWALRPLGEGDRMRVERPDLRAALAKHLGFARSMESLQQNAKPVRDVAALHSFASTAFDNETSLALSLSIEEILIRGGFAWEVVFADHLDRLQGFAALVVAGQSHLGDAECAAVRAFAQAGGAVILAGENGRCDETGRERARPALDDLRGDRVVRLESSDLRASGSGYEMRVVLPAGWRSLAETIERAMGDRFTARLRGSDAVTLSAWELDGKRLAAHLVNYASGESPQDLRLDLGARWKECRSARFRTPGLPERNLVAGGASGFGVEIPPFSTYGVVVIE